MEIERCVHQGNDLSPGNHRVLVVLGQSRVSNCKSHHANHSSRRQLHLAESGSDLVRILRSGATAHIIVTLNTPGISEPPKTPHSLT